MAQIFYGIEGQSQAFEIRINVESYRRVKTDYAIDLGMSKFPGPSGQPLSVELYESMTTLLDVLWSLVRPVAQKGGFSKDKFEAAMFGLREDGTSPYLEAREKFFAEWMLFFRNLNRSEDAEILENFLAAMPVQLRATIENQRSQLGQTSTDSSKNTPASLESKTSAPSLSGS